MYAHILLHDIFSLVSEVLSIRHRHGRHRIRHELLPRHVLCRLATIVVAGRIGHIPWSSYKKDVHYLHRVTAYMLCRSNHMNGKRRVVKWRHVLVINVLCQLHYLMNNKYNIIFFTPVVVIVVLKLLRYYCD